jgi:hypothetical protein
MHKKLIFLLLSILLLSACQPTPAPTPEPTITLTSTPSQTATPTLTPTRTPIPTWTPEPSFAEMPEDFQAQIKEMLETNENCDFPCWWGIYPGETIFENAQQFIKPLSITSGTYVSDQGNSIFYSRILVPVSINSRGYLNFNMVREIENNDKIKVINVSGYFYPMAEILNRFGEPSEIHFFGPLIFPTDTVQFELFLFFPEKGVLVTFSTTTETPEPEDQIDICDLDTQFWPSKLIGFSLWNPIDSLSFDEIDNFLTGGNPSPIAPIELISNMNPHTFYLNFSQPNPECLVIDTALYGSQTN